MQGRGLSLSSFLEVAMDRERMDALACRVERLEGELSRWKTLGLAALVALGLVVLIWAPWGGLARADEDKEYTIAVPPEVFKMGQPKEVEEIRVPTDSPGGQPGRTEGEPPGLDHGDSEPRALRRQREDPGFLERQGERLAGPGLLRPAGPGHLESPLRKAVRGLRLNSSFEQDDMKRGQAVSSGH